MKHVFKLCTWVTADISLFATVTTYTQKIFFMFLPSLDWGVLYLNYKHFSCLKLSKDDRRKCFICLNLSDWSILIDYYSFGEHDWGLIEGYVMLFLITVLSFFYFLKYVQVQRRCNETLYWINLHRLKLNWVLPVRVSVIGYPNILVNKLTHFYPVSGELWLAGVFCRMSNA